MKKFISNVILLLSINSAVSNQNNLSTVTQNDHTVVDTLYVAYKSNPTFYKTHANHLIDGYVDLTAKRIQLWQDAIRTKNYWPYLEKKDKKDCIGLGVESIGCIGVSLIIMYEICKNHFEFLSGRFTTIKIPYEIFKKSSSTRCSIAKKRYLKKFKVEQITIEDYWKLSQYDNQGKEVIAKLSDRYKEKLKYTALDYAISSHKKQLLNNLVFPALFLIIGIIAGCCSFYYFIRQGKIIAAKLEHDKELYTIFKEEQEHRLSLISNTL